MEGEGGGLVRIYGGDKHVVIPTLIGSAFHTTSLTLTTPSKGIREPKTYYEPKANIKLKVDSFEVSSL